MHAASTHREDRPPIDVPPRLAATPGWSPPAAAHLGTAAIGLLVALMFFPDPQFPAAGLDPSWMLASEHAAQAGLVFGRDFIFTYGPLAFLSTHLYRQGSFAFVILGEIYLSLLFVLPLLGARGLAPKLFYLAAAFMAPFGTDPRIATASFALLAVTLERRNAVTVLLAALMAPFLLAKFSYAPVVLPLLALADARHLAGGRRLPVFLPAALVAFLFSYLGVGQPLSALPALVLNVGDVVGGYSGAMQIGGGLPVLAVGLLTAALLAFGVWLIGERWRSADQSRPWKLVALTAGLAWTLFMVFKMGHVRQDEHTVITWQALIALVPILVAWSATIAPLDRQVLIPAGTLMALAGAGSIYLTDWRQIERSPLSSGEATLPLTGWQRPESILLLRAGSLVLRPIDSLKWALPDRWREMTALRQAAEASLARPFPPSVSGSVDAIPYDVAPLIVSGLNYRPRPVPQSYSAFTPRLQRLDADFLADPRTAPDTLLFKLGDIDGRLPTFATGPTLPILLRWYMPAGEDPLGLILRHRTAPTPATLHQGGRRSFALFDTIAVPAEPGAVTIARITLPKTFTGRLLGFLFREPTLTIEVSLAGGAVRNYRFVPGMAEAGFLISPLPLASDAAGLSDPAPLFTSGGAGMATVSGIRITGGGAARLAFDAGEICFATMKVAP